MNGDLSLVGGDRVTRSLLISAVQLIVTLTSVSTQGGSVAVQVKVREVPSFSAPLETLTVTVGAGTAL